MDLEDPHTRSFASFLCAKLIPDFGSLSKEDAHKAYMRFVPIMMPTLKALPPTGSDIDGEGGHSSWERAAEISLLLLIQDQLEAEGHNPDFAVEMVTDEATASVLIALRATGVLFLELRGEFELRTLASDFESLDLDEELRSLLENPGGLD